MNNMKKKIIFSSYDDIENPYYAGGGARIIRKLSAQLAEFYDVVVITGNYPGAQNIVVNNVTYKRIGFSFVGPRLGQLLFHFFLPYSIKREKFDVWIESFTPPFSTSCLQLFTKKPVIGLVHMLASEDMQRKYKLPFHLIENKGLQTYKYIITLTEASKRKIREQTQTAKIFVIPNATDIQTNIKKEKLANNENYILFLGRLEKDQKGVDLLIEAYASIANKTNVKLIIAGTGQHKDIQEINEQIKKYQLQEKILLVGKVDGVKKEQLLANASLVAIPSRFDTSPIVALEAMSYGKPMVGFAIDGLDWLPTEAVLKAKCFDTHELGKNMYKIITDNNLQKKLSQASQKAIERYSWKNITAEYKKCIESITQ